MTPTVRLVAAAALLVLVACQPVDEPELDDVAEAGEADTSAEPVGGPAHALPDDLDALLGDFRGTATQWQAEPVAAEIVVELVEDRWASATVTYLAPDADRFLLLRTGPDGTSQERPTLEGFELLPVSAEAVADIPGPGALLDPLALVEAAEAVLEECEVGEPAAVLYSTGAPAAWDGQRWTEEPRWRATVSGAAAAMVDPMTGEAGAPDPCLPV